MGLSWVGVVLEGEAEMGGRDIGRVGLRWVGVVLAEMGVVLGGWAEVGVVLGG